MQCKPFGLLALLRQALHWMINEKKCLMGLFLCFHAEKKDPGFNFHRNYPLNAQHTFSTTKRALSASCWATCFISTASVNSLPKVKCVWRDGIKIKCMYFTSDKCKHRRKHIDLNTNQFRTSDTSSKMRPKVLALSVRSSLTCRETSSLCVISSPASNRAYKEEPQMS